MVGLSGLFGVGLMGMKSSNFCLWGRVGLVYLSCLYSLLEI